MSTRLNLRWLPLAAAILIATNSVPAKPNITSFPLEFTPQQHVAAEEVTLHHSLLEHPVRLRLIDERPIALLAEIGSRTNDDDQLFKLKATNEVLPFVEQVSSQLLRDWGVIIDDDAELVLAVTLRRFALMEINQAVGASFDAVVRFDAELQNRSGDTLWSGSSIGDAARYGKKFSNPNCNEVLSDALLEAWPNLLSQRGLIDAWGGNVTPRNGDKDNGPVSPAELLQEVKVLMEHSFESQTIIDYVGQKTLSARLQSKDLLDWKRAGVAEEVLRTAIRLPVH